MDHWSQKVKWNYHGEDFRSFVNLPFCFWRDRAGEKNSRTEYGHHPTRTGYRENLKEKPRMGSSSRHSSNKRKNVYGAAKEKGKNKIQCGEKYPRKK